MRIMECEGHKTGLFFGSFNPVHIGHMALANYFLEFTPINDLQFILSPQSPLKTAGGLLPEQHRLQMLEVALTVYPDLPISINTVEFDMPKPSYTISTLTKLQKQNPDTTYLILMGADNLAGIEKWKDYRKILSDFEICVYPRAGYDLQELSKRYGAISVGAPEIEISATFLRAAIRSGYNFSTYFPHGVWDYIKNHELYLETDKEE